MYKHFTKDGNCKNISLQKFSQCRKLTWIIVIQVNETYVMGSEISLKMSFFFNFSLIFYQVNSQDCWHNYPWSISVPVSYDHCKCCLEPMAIWDLSRIIAGHRPVFFIKQLGTYPVSLRVKQLGNYPVSLRITDPFCYKAIGDLSRIIAGHRPVLF